MARGQTGLRGRRAQRVGAVSRPRAADYGADDSRLLADADGPLGIQLLVAATSAQLAGRAGLDRCGAGDDLLLATPDGRRPQAVRNRALIALLLDSGLRLAEVAGITLGELDLKDQIVRIHGKGRKDRPVPFSEGTVDYLRTWIRVRGGEAGSLFGLSRYGIRQLLTRIGQETGIHVHPHKFRHTAATMMVRENMDLHSIKRVLGHSHLSVTEKYLSLSTEDLKNKHNAASPLERVRSLMPATAARPKRRRLGLD